MPRLRAVDGLRGLAIIMVTGLHLYNFTRKAPIVLGPLDLSPLFEGGFYGVELFFCLSGFALYRSLATADKVAWTGFLRRRFARLLPPYYVALLLWLPLWGINHGLVGWERHFFAHVTFTHGFFLDTIFSISGVLWFLAPLAHLYLLFPLLRAGVRRAPWLTLAGTVLLAWWAPRTWPGVLVGRSCLVYAFPFVLGMVTARLAADQEGWPRALLPALAIYAAAVLLLRPYMLSLSLPLQGGWAALLLLALRLPEACWSWAPLRGLAYVGRISYSLFLYNYALQWLPTWLWPGLAVGSRWWWVLAAASPLVAGVPAYYLVERPVWLRCLPSLRPASDRAH